MVAEEKIISKQSVKLSPLQMAVGPLATMALVVGILITGSSDLLPRPSLLLLAVAGSAFKGGMRSGIISAFIAFSYLAHNFAFADNTSAAAVFIRGEQLALWSVSAVGIIFLIAGLHRQLAEQGFDGAILGHTLRRYRNLLLFKRKVKDLERNVAEYQQLEGRLLAREEQLRLVIDALPMAVIYLDRELRLRFVNKTYAGWRNRPMSALVGRTYEEVIGPTLFRQVRKRINAAFAGESSICEADVVYPDKRRTLNCASIPDVATDGQVRGVINVITDVTAQRSIEAELRRAKEDAEAGSRAKSFFLANMSHEIRTPLGAVIGFSELLLNPELSASERFNAVAAIKRNGALLSNLISDILDLSKVEAGKLTVEKAATSLAELITDVTTLLNLQANEKGIALSVRSEGVVPEFVATDTLRLRQVLINVVGNAIKFTNKGSVDVVIKQIASAAGSPQLAFVVKDTGPGIAKEQQKKIFEPFGQADESSTRSFGGTGLGLPLAKKLAHLLGGDVQLVDSSVGNGSTFLVTIDPGDMNKLVFIGGDKAFASGAMQQEHQPQMRLENVRILLVEDSADNQLLIRRLLSLAGADVDVASNGREGVEMALAKTYDVLLMDLQMPVMDGYEATKELRRLGCKASIVALTAHALKEERQRCLLSGFDDHLTKPIDRDAMLQMLHKVKVKSQGATGLAH